MILRKIDQRVRGLATGVGWISLGMGLPLALAPGKTAEILGWGDREFPARLVGASDLIIGMGLLLDRSRSRWMLARTFLNVAIALVYVSSLSDETRRWRTVGGIGLMAGLTVVDYSLSRRLREVENRLS